MHINNISLTFPSNVNCKTNKIKGMRFHSSAQSSLDTQTSGFEWRNCHFVLILTSTVQLMKGKMNAYSLLVIIILTCCINRYTSIGIKPELKKNILKIWLCYKLQIWGYFNSFYVVTKFIWPTIKDLNFSLLNFDDRCENLQELKEKHSEEKQNILDLITYCRKIRPFVYYYKRQITSLNHTVMTICKIK